VRRPVFYRGWLVVPPNGARIVREGSVGQGPNTAAAAHRAAAGGLLLRWDTGRRHRNGKISAEQRRGLRGARSGQRSQIQV